MKRVPELLLEATTIYEERNRLYGNNYKLPVMSLLFPNGIMLRSEEDFIRYGAFVQIVAKVTRYAAQFNKNGHADSLNDLAVYAMLLREIDEELDGGEDYIDKEIEPELPLDEAEEVDRMRGKPVWSPPYQ
jgi:hypothetical protein